MADEPRTPISADVKVGIEEFGRSVGRGAAALGRWPDGEDLRRARAARAWLYRGRPSDDSAVARQVLVEHRSTQRRWSRFDSWWSKALLAAFALVWAASLVARARGGMATGAVVAQVGLLLCIFFSLLLAPRIEARRTPRMEQAAAQAQALLDRSGRR